MSDSCPPLIAGSIRYPVHESQRIYCTKYTISVEATEPCEIRENNVDRWKSCGRDENPEGNTPNTLYFLFITMKMASQVPPKPPLLLAAWGMGCRWGSTPSRALDPADDNLCGILIAPIVLSCIVCER